MIRFTRSPDWSEEASLLTLYPDVLQDRSSPDSSDILSLSFHCAAVWYCRRSSWFMKKKQNLFSCFFIGFPSMQISSSGKIFSPVETTVPRTVTRPASVSLSASLLEQTPASLKYLLILIFSSIILLYIFSWYSQPVIFLVFF